MRGCEETPVECSLHRRVQVRSKESFGRGPVNPTCSSLLHITCTVVLVNKKLLFLQVGEAAQLILELDFRSQTFKCVLLM